MTEEHIAWGIMSGDLKWFIVSEGTHPVGSGTVRIFEQPSDGQTVASFQQFGGDLYKMIPLMDEFETWLKALGATKIRMFGRRGWARKLPRWGYAEKFIVMEKEIA
jgi:hypothetical protein